MPRGVAALLAAGSLTVAVWGWATAATGVPDPGIHVSPPPGTVLWVLPGGPAWESGARVGQVAGAISTGTTAMDWALVTRDGPAEYHVTIRSATATLRGLLPLASIALLLAVLAAVATSRSLRVGSAFASLAGSIGSIALSAGGEPVVSTLGGLAALAFPIGWLLTWGLGGARSRRAVAVVAFAVATAWLMARFVMPSVYEATEAMRLTTAVALSLALTAATLNPAGILAHIRSVGEPVALDFFGLGLAGGTALALWLVLGASPILVAVATGISAFLYLRTRRPLARAIDHAVFGDRERRASIAAVEAERARLAHEIHDEPLQALGASIRRLETAPDPEGEVARLRELAARLRSVATELRPPVLDDLGLGPALELLADQAAADHATISVSIATDDRTGRSGDSRLPPDVEVALYRIVQEAIANARRHSGGTCVEVSGQIERDYARLSVSDDGVGLSAPRSELGPSSGPPRSGHLGLRSMRARATAIGADLEIGDRQGGGTRVAVEWRRR